MPGIWLDEKKFTYNSKTFQALMYIILWKLKKEKASNTGLSKYKSDIKITYIFYYVCLWLDVALSENYWTHLRQ